MTFKTNIFHFIKQKKDLWNLTRTFNNTPLIVAASNGHSAIVETLLSQEGIEINSKDI